MFQKTAVINKHLVFLSTGDDNRVHSVTLQEAQQS